MSLRSWRCSTTERAVINNQRCRALVLIVTVIELEFIRPCIERDGVRRIVSRVPQVVARTILHGYGCMCAFLIHTDHHTSYVLISQHRQPSHHVVAGFRQHFLHDPNMIGETSGDGRRRLQRTVDRAEVVDADVQTRPHSKSTTPGFRPPPSAFRLPPLREDIYRKSPLASPSSQTTSAQNRVFCGI